MPLHVLLEIGKHTPGPLAVLRVQGADLSILQIRDEPSGTPYLINMGAEVSILPTSHFPHSSTGSPATTTLHLFAPNGTSINTYGTCTWTLHLRGQCFTILLLVADIHFPVLGADFLRCHQLLVKVASRRLVLPSLTSSIPWIAAKLPSSRLSMVSGSCPIRAILSEYQQITNPIFSSSFPNHGIFHRIPTQGQKDTSGKYFPHYPDMV